MSQGKNKVLEVCLERIGQKLIDLRKGMGYHSHETFALDHDLPRVQYWRMERGRANMTLNSLSRILSIHHISIEEFFFKLYLEEPSVAANNVSNKLKKRTPHHAK